MIKVYGYSDDNLVLDGAPYPADEIGCYDQVVEIEFSDGTNIRAGYSKPNLAVWWIRVDKHGSAEQRLTICNDEDADPYSDAFEIEADIVRYRLCSYGSSVPGDWIDVVNE